MRYRELPFGTRREEIEAALSELGAEKCGVTYGYHVAVHEHFRVGRRKLRVCTEDEYFVSLWGSRALVDEVYARLMVSWEARRESGV